MDEKDEIGDLSHSFDKMVAAIRKSRKEVDEQVKTQTAELLEKQKKLENQQGAMMNVLDDVEAEKKRAEELVADLEKFKLALNNISDHVVITDADGIVLYGNKMVEKITGFTLEESLGKKAGTLWSFPMSTEYYAALWDIIKNKKEPFTGELKNRRKNGEVYDAAISISPILSEERTVQFFVGIERDVTREREVDRAKSEFVSLASHQLRTPLSAINWYAEMLLSGDGGRIPKAAREYLEEIRHGGKRMTELVGALLNVSRIEMGTFAVSPEPTDILLLAQDVLDELKPNIREKRIHIETKFLENLPKLSVDPKLIRIVFQNLLTNAVKYTPEEGTVSVSIRLLPEEKVFSIEVSDTGYGIPKGEQTNIFTKLFRASNVREKETDGTGLGLYIVKSIVEHSGGAIRFESEEGKGTTFTLTLPLSGMEQKEGTRSIEWKEAL